MSEIRNVVEKIKGDLMSERPYVIDEMISAKAIAARVEELCKNIQNEFVVQINSLSWVCCEVHSYLLQTWCVN